jgi:hypothetical protein
MYYSIACGTRTEYGRNGRGGEGRGGEVNTMNAYITDDVTFHLNPNGCYTSSILASLCNLTFPVENAGKLCNEFHHGNKT